MLHRSCTAEHLAFSTTALLVLGIVVARSRVDRGNGTAIVARTTSAPVTARATAAPAASRPWDPSREGEATAAPSVCASVDRGERRLTGDTDPLRIGRRALRAVQEGRAASLWDHGSEALRGVFEYREDALARFLAETRAELGDEVAPLEECVVATGNTWTYQRTGRRERTEVSIAVEIQVGGDGSIASLEVRPAAVPYASSHDHYRTRAALRLPFDGEWFVLWGGRHPLENTHATKRVERFAYDFAPLPSADGDASSILAPADATVAVAVDGVEANAPGTTNEAQPFGNHVVLDLGGGELAMLAHMTRGSLRVRAGDHVRAGDAVGTVGNSGHSTRTHLHFHLQNILDANGADGLPAQFVGYVADGAGVARGEPLRGQCVAQPSGEAR